MRYYVETQTWRRDGSEYWVRRRVQDYEQAKSEARLIAEQAFRDQACFHHQYEIGASPIFLNDLGEFMTIRAARFGDQAQVREGAFFL